MKNVFLVLVFLFVLVGCASQSNVNSPGTACADVPNDKYLECLSKQGPATEPAAVQKTPVDGQPVITETAPTDPATPPPPKATPPAKKKLQPKPSDMPEPPVFDPRPPPKVNPPFPPGMPTSADDMFVTPDFLPVGDNGCMPKQNLSVHNDSSFYIEVTGKDLRPCGDGGSLIPLIVSQDNGSTRIAYVIPPDEIGMYYFYPKRTVPGTDQTVTTNGKKYYTIRTFDTGSVKGLLTAMSSDQDVVVHEFVMTPIVGGIWWRYYFTEDKIATAKAMKPKK